MQSLATCACCVLQIPTGLPTLEPTTSPSSSPTSSPSAMPTWSPTQVRAGPALTALGDWVEAEHLTHVLVASAPPRAMAGSYLDADHRADTESVKQPDVLANACKASVFPSPQGQPVVRLNRPISGRMCVLRTPDPDWAADA